MNLLTHTRPKSSCPSLSLPAVIDCPAHSRCLELAEKQSKYAICNQCYALAGHYRFPCVKSSQTKRSEWWHSTSPTDRAMILADAVRREGSPQYFRCYDSGDLDLSAVETWLRFAELLPGTKVWIPTRTWLLPEYLPHLRMLNCHQQIVVRPSAIAFDDPPPHASGLAAGLTSHWHQAPKSQHVCPGDCSNCRVCWDCPTLSVSFERRPP